MLNRSLRPLKSQSFFLFGARGTGKTTLLDVLFPTAYRFDLLDSNLFLDLSNNLGLFEERVRALAPEHEWFIVDEVQKLPRLLDAIHRLIFANVAKFAITGSSARKLKRGSANLLAGRALLNYLYPLTHEELGERFDLNEALSWGTLPNVALTNDIPTKRSQLGAYAHTYLKEEIAEEQTVRQLEPFRRFLGIAADGAGRIVNFSKIARDVGISVVTVQAYFQILEDTLIGHFIEPYHRSIRKRQRNNPKFYFFDCGVTRALNSRLGEPTTPAHAEYGHLFEQFVVNEIIRLQHYRHTFQSNYYLRTEDDQEIDLIVEGSGPTYLVEIKSSIDVDDQELRTLTRFQREIPNSEAICICRTAVPRRHGNVTVLGFEEGIQRIVGKSRTEK